MVLAKQSTLAPRFLTPGLNNESSDKAGHLDTEARDVSLCKYGSFNGWVNDIEDVNYPPYMVASF